VLLMAERTQQLAVDDAMVAESCVEERAELLRHSGDIIVERLCASGDGGGGGRQPAGGAAQVPAEPAGMGGARVAGGIIVTVRTFPAQRMTGTDGSSTFETLFEHSALMDARYDLLLAGASTAHRRACGGGPRVVLTWLQ
jgi:hypothetical protein